MVALETLTGNDQRLNVEDILSCESHDQSHDHP